jgi:DNA-binding NtrC family response regulator
MELIRGVRPVTSYRGGLLEDVVLERGVHDDDGMLEILPFLARLCAGEAVIADAGGRCLRRIDRSGTVFPLREGQVSSLAHAVARTGKPQWEVDEGSGALRVALPVGNRIVEFLQGSESRLDGRGGPRPLRLAAGTDVGPGFDSLVDKSAPSLLSAKYSWADIVGDGPALAKAIARGQAAARRNAPVFLNGESGTGKELFAQAIHNASERRHGPFVAINCSALPDSLADSMLFGFMDGTFTGARKGGRPGVFEQADGGTLLLDEITEINVEIQAKLLRVIQEREVCRIGSVKPLPIDVRIIVTSNRDLYRRMREGLFREDLYYRLNVIDIHLPPLRERREDVPAIVDSMIAEMAASIGHGIREIRPDAMQWLAAQPWPGNVRELRNVVERAVSLAEGEVLYLHHFARDEPQRAQAVHEAAPLGAHLCDRVAHAEEASIMDALRRNAGHRGKTAAELGISVTTLWRRMRRIGAAAEFPQQQ